MDIIQIRETQKGIVFFFESNVDPFGWAVDHAGKHHFTVFVENGRVQDEPGLRFKTGLREVAKLGKCRFRLTANQHVILTDIATEDVPEIKRLLSEYKMDNISHSGLRLSSSACVAFPTCGLAMAESELDKQTVIVTDLTRKVDELQVRADEATRLKDQLDEYVRYRIDMKRVIEWHIGIGMRRTSFRRQRTSWRNTRRSCRRLRTCDSKSR